jgi:hypothetical protein
MNDTQIMMDFIAVLSNRSDVPAWAFLSIIVIFAIIRVKMRLDNDKQTQEKHAEALKLKENKNNWMIQLSSEKIKMVKKHFESLNEQSKKHQVEQEVEMVIKENNQQQEQGDTQEQDPAKGKFYDIKYKLLVDKKDN